MAEIAARLRAAGDAWRKLQASCICCKFLNAKAKYRVFECLVLSRLVYGSENWSFTRRQLRPLRKFYNRCLRKIAGISYKRQWHEHISNADIRLRIGAPNLQELLDRSVLR